MPIPHFGGEEEPEALPDEEAESEYDSLSGSDEGGESEYDLSSGPELSDVDEKESWRVKLLFEPCSAPFCVHGHPAAVEISLGHAAAASILVGPTRVLGPGPPGRHVRTVLLLVGKTLRLPYVACLLGSLEFLCPKQRPRFFRVKLHACHFSQSVCRTTPAMQLLRQQAGGPRNTGLPHLQPHLHSHAACLLLWHQGLPPPAGAWHALLAAAWLGAALAAIDPPPCPPWGLPGLPWTDALPWRTAAGPALPPALAPVLQAPRGWAPG